MQTLIGIILFALATMILYAWGYIKEQRRPMELLDKLYKKGEKTVIGALKRNEKLTRQEIIDIVSQMRASNFGSRRKVVIKEPEKFVKTLLNNMEEKGLIEKDYSGKKNKYKLKDKS